MGSWSFESFEDTHGAGGVALPEAESWTRWRTGSRCCSSATAFGEESSVPSTNFYVHMNNPLGRHPDPHHFMGCGTHLDWKECHHGGGPFQPPSPSPPDTYTRTQMNSRSHTHHFDFLHLLLSLSLSYTSIDKSGTLEKTCGGREPQGTTVPFCARLRVLRS